MWKRNVPNDDEDYYGQNGEETDQEDNYQPDEQAVYFKENYNQDSQEPNTYV